MEYGQKRKYFLLIKQTRYDSSCDAWCQSVGRELKYLADVENLEVIFG